MNAPSSLARLSAAPPVTLALFLGYGVVILGWYQGGLPWWLALGAAGAALRTLSAVNQVRRYKAWAAQWQAMGAPLHAPPQPKKRGGSAWMVVTGAVLLVFAIPAYLTQIRNDSEQVASALNWLWVAVCLFLVFKSFGLVRRFFARSSARSTARLQAKEEAQPVAWLVGRASSSPSRAEAQRNLPEYVARLG